MGFESSDAWGLVSAIVAIVSVLLNFLVVLRQEGIQREALRLQLDSSIIEWSAKGIDDLSEAIEFVRAGRLAGAEQDLVALRSKVSSRIDQGRVFFENENTSSYTHDADPLKNPGDRPAVLDALKFTHHVLNDPRSASLDREQLASYVEQCRRLFYTEIQKTIDPRSRRKILRRMKRDREENKLKNLLAEELNRTLPGLLKRFGANP